MKYLFGFPAIYGKTPPIYVYISAVERLTLDAEQNDLQHVFREARMVTENLFFIKETQMHAGLGIELVFTSAQSYWITVTLGRLKLLLTCPSLLCHPILQIVFHPF